MEGTLTIVTNTDPHGIHDNVFRVGAGMNRIDQYAPNGIKVYAADGTTTFFPWTSVHHTFFSPKESA